MQYNVTLHVLSNASFSEMFTERRSFPSRVSAFSFSDVCLVKTNAGTGTKIWKRLAGEIYEWRGVRRGEERSLLCVWRGVCIESKEEFAVGLEGSLGYDWRGVCDISGGEFAMRLQRCLWCVWRRVWDMTGGRVWRMSGREFEVCVDRSLEYVWRGVCDISGGEFRMCLEEN